MAPKLLTSNKSNLFEVKLSDLHPTQFCIGQREVDDKMSKYSKMSKKEFNEMLVQKAIPIVIGPGSKLYLIDRHHNATTLIRLGEKVGLAYLKADFSHLEKKTFWSVMEQCRWNWLYNEDYKKVSPDLLPLGIIELNNDPFRSLTYMLREAKILNKDESVPFIEFYWAEQIRKHIKTLTNEHLDLAFIEVQRLLKSGTLVIADCDFKQIKEDL